ncbi:hypothetical protein, partial [Alkalihalophilus marmarensis]|uniref:hypothetical protein n=1 Tax=Alkalihalophilus marmarensis TaxID=521377 RepID=UPI0004CFB458
FEADVAAARAAYDGLTATQQALVTNLLDLEAAEQTVDERNAFNVESASNGNTIVLTYSPAVELPADLDGFATVTDGAGGTIDAAVATEADGVLTITLEDGDDASVTTVVDGATVTFTVKVNGADVAYTATATDDTGITWDITVTP